MDMKDNLGYLFHHVSFVLARQSDQVLQEQLGIGFSQFKILMILQGSNGIPQRQIANKLGQTEASVSRQIKILQDQTLLTSQVSPTNRREHITRLTSRGAKLIEKAEQILNAYHSPIFAKLSDRQQQQLRELLTAMHEAACQGVEH